MQNTFAMVIDDIYLFCIYIQIGKIILSYSKN